MSRTTRRDSNDTAWDQEPKVMKMLTRFWSMPSLRSLLPLSSRAPKEPEGLFERPTRYMALGDSLAAGYGAVPATRGYVYLLYQSSAFDSLDRTHFCNAGVPGATSLDVLEHQVPQAVERFHPTVITLSVGGNDLLTLLNGAELHQVLHAFSSNLAEILRRLHAGLPEVRIFMNNFYCIPKIPETEKVIPVFNRVIDRMAQSFGVPVADVYGFFIGKEGLLQIERNGAPRDEVHPTNAGYRVMAEAFKDAITRGNVCPAESRIFQAS